MNLRTRFTRGRGRALLVVAVSLLLLAAAPVFAVSTGLVHFPSSAIQAEGPTASDEADGANDVQNGSRDQVGPDETDGANSDVQDGAQNQDGTDHQDQPAPGG
jgi:hypothetical protein